MTQTALTTASPLDLAGIAANRKASRTVILDYRSRKAPNTIRRQDADLDLFAEYLQSAGVPLADFASDPQAWRGITWGLVDGFVKWQLLKGYAVESVGVRLSTVKTYAKLAMQAGQLEPSEYAMIRTVSAYSHKEGKRIDDRRRKENIPVRVSPKKTEPVPLTPDKAAMLLNQANTPLGRRDRLLLCLMIEHGLRVGEVEGLKVEAFDLAGGMFTFYRQKVDKTQTHKMTDNTLLAARAYLRQDAPKSGCVWRRGSTKGTNELAGPGLTVRAIAARVQFLGRLIGESNLSPHDLRHYWATQASRNGTAIKDLQDAGGWNSPAMPLHYIQSAEIANAGVK